MKITLGLSCFAATNESRDDKSSSDFVTTFDIIAESRRFMYHSNVSTGGSRNMSLILAVNANIGRVPVLVDASESRANGSLSATTRFHFHSRSRQKQHWCACAAAACCLCACTRSFFDCFSPGVWMTRQASKATNQRMYDSLD